MSNLDCTTLERHRDLGDDVVAQLISLVIESLQRNAAAIAAAPSDLENVVSAAHAIKNSSSNVGATRLFAVAERLERATDLHTAAQLIPELEAALVAVVGELEART